jgi:hypothetical protein
VARLDRVVLAVRQSPDWAALARDWQDGVQIDPRRYRPPREVPDFPADIADLIAAWNALSAVDFFACRRRLKEIAAATLRAVAGARIVSYAALPALMNELAGRRFVLFFCDDDDWFAPDLFATLRGLDLDGIDVAVFPFVRFGRGTCSFVHPRLPPRAAVGPRYRFSQRYHTNNYGLHDRICRPQTLLAMQDHFDASAHADRVGLIDRHFAVILGATNKTPCAASYLRATVADPAGFARLIARHIGELRSHDIPAGLDWMRPPLAATIELFESVLAGTVASGA